MNNKIKTIHITEKGFDGMTGYQESCKGRTLIGELKSVHAIPNIYRTLKNDGLDLSNLAYIGGLGILITLKSNKMARTYLAEKEIEWKQYFQSLNVWNDEELPFERLIALRIHGVPIMLKSPEVYDKIASEYGRLVDSSNFSWKDYDVACGVCFVITNTGDPINEKIELSWKNKKYTVWVNEESLQWKLHEDDDVESMSDDDSDSDINSIEGDDHNDELVQENMTNQKSPEILPENVSGDCRNIKGSSEDDGSGNIEMPTDTINSSNTNSKKSDDDSSTALNTDRLNSSHDDVVHAVNVAVPGVNNTLNVSDESSLNINPNNPNGEKNNTIIFASVQPSRSIDLNLSTHSASRSRPSSYRISRNEALKNRCDYIETTRSQQRDGKFWKNRSAFIAQPDDDFNFETNDETNEVSSTPRIIPDNAGFSNSPHDEVEKTIAVAEMLGIDLSQHGPEILNDIIGERGQTVEQ